MSGNEYYFEMHRNSYEYEQNYDNDSKISPDAYESASENLLTDYEVVSNEEGDGVDDRGGVAYRKLRREKTESALLSQSSCHSLSSAERGVKGHGKLHLSLSAEKISLKSQSEKIDKSNASLETEIAVKQKETVANRERCVRTAKTTSASGFCPRHRRQQQQQQPHQQKLGEKNKAKQYTPINFTIVPINVAAQRRCNGLKQIEDGRDLPEIVLTSFEQQQQGGRSSSALEAVTITSRRDTQTGSRESLLEKHQQSEQYRSTMLSKATKVVVPIPPPLPPPTLLPPPPLPSPSTTTGGLTKVKKVTRFSRAPEFTNNHFELVSATATAHTSFPVPVMANTKLAEAEDTSISEINSQPGSSTSPESLMDNILSAASSVSVRSSSLSSAGGASGGSGGGGGSEIPKIVNVTPSGSVEALNDVPHVAIEAVVIERQQQQQPLTLQTNELHDNRSLNLKSPGSRGLSPSLTIPSEKQIATAALTPLPPSTTLPRTLNTSLQILSPARTSTSSPSPSHSVRAFGARLSSTRTLQPSELIEASANRSRSPSPSSSILNRVTPDLSLFSDDLKCRICNNVFQDPRTLNCLHSFCFQCLVDENFKQDSSIPFWSQPGAEEHDWKGE